MAQDTEGDFWSQELREELWWDLNRDRVRNMRLLQGLLPELVDMACIPKARGKFLRIFIRSSLQHAWDLHYQRKAPGFPRNLIAADNAMRVAMDAINSLDDKERNLLESELERNCDSGLDGYLGGEISEIADALERAARVARSTPKRNGRPRGTVNANNEKLRSFILHFYRSVVVACSGRLSLDPKNGGSGSLIRALRLIEPCLPKHFLPKVLPVKSIGRWISTIKRTTPKTYRA
jgi:hypothetical protein